MDQHNKHLRVEKKKYRLFYALEEHLEIPMFLLALVWLFFFVKEMFFGLSNLEQDLILVIWILFILEFLFKLLISPDRLRFLRRNWLSGVALAIPALRVFRLFRALALLRSVRVVNPTNIIRAVTSGKRFISALKDAQGPPPAPEMDLGIVLAYSKAENKNSIEAYAEELAKEAVPELEASSGIAWRFDLADEIRLEKDETLRPSDFLDAASQRMAEGPYDVILVLTDVAIVSQEKRIVAGASSKVSRILVMSTRKLTATGKGMQNLDLQDAGVRVRSVAVLLKLMGQMFGLPSRLQDPESLMARPAKQWKTTPQYSSKEKKRFREIAKRIPDRELRNGSWLESLIFHILMTCRHPKQFFLPLFKNRSFLLSLSLPGLATAAVAPSFIFVFTAEIWDVGFGMTNAVAATFAIVSIVLSSFYLVNVQSLFLPRKEKTVLTEHLAVANSVIYFSILLACLGLFLMVLLLMLVIEFYVFPPDLMQTWPSLETGEITFADQLRLAVFIATVGVITGALAGGFDKRTVIQHLSLFNQHVS